MIKFTLNDKELEVPDGTTILQAARANGVTIPTLCDHPDLTPYGGCRLCLVEVEGARVPQAACTMPAGNGMKVKTETPALINSRRMVLELLLTNYYDSGYTPTKNPEKNELLHWVQQYDLKIPEDLKPKKPRYEVNSDPNPFVWVDLNKCILCTRCVRACAEVQGRFVWGCPSAASRRTSPPESISPCSTRAANRAARAWPTARRAHSTTRCRWTWASPINWSRRPAPTAASAASSI